MLEAMVKAQMAPPTRCRGTRWPASPPAGHAPRAATPPCAISIESNCIQHPNEPKPDCSSESAQISREVVERFYRVLAARSRQWKSIWDGQRGRRCLSLAVNCL